MRDTLIKIIKNTFELESGADFQVVTTMPEALHFEQLPALLSCLANQYTSPKALAQALEIVVINIRLKTEPTCKEQAFLQQVIEIIYAPLDAPPMSMVAGVSRPV